MWSNRGDYRKVVGKSLNTGSDNIIIIIIIINKVFVMRYIGKMLQRRQWQFLSVAKQV